MQRHLVLVLLALFFVACGAESTGDTDDEGTPDAEADATGEVDAGADVDPDGPDGTECIDTDGDGYGPGCIPGGDCNDADATSFPGAEERCGDGLDNDCSGIVDDGCPCDDGAVAECFDGPVGVEGVGTCRAGTTMCVGGQWGPCNGSVVPTDEICDGVDNDCNGETDEGVSNACGQCGEVPLEICDDGLDNDCNGTIDDVTAGCSCGGRIDQPCYSGPPATLGTGACAGGRMDCIEGEWGTCRGESVPAEETCDGIDNDCDGDIDENLRNACGDCSTVDPPELCDDLDNDCDGTVDEGVRAACGLCPEEIGDEECGDGFDNNCDGAVDEGCSCSLGDPACYPGPAETLGIGVCAGGTRECDPTGEFWTECTGFTLPSVEVCDGLDNDCDGTVDLNPLGCSVCSTDPEICDNEDNDCDGVIDEGQRNACGVCLIDVIPEEDLGSEFCDGMDDDCDGLIDEGLLNECGTCEGCNECEFWMPGWSAEERCGDGQDNNMDGQADEGCDCEFGTTQPCFLGAPNARRIGACLDGTQTCVNRTNPQWGPCEGGILPSEEICDGKDNDCNGCTDEGSCDVMLNCPVEDYTKPLRDYQLTGSDIYDGMVDSWRWSVDAPDGSSTMGPANPNAENTSFYVDISGDYLVTVEITINGETFTCSWIVHAAGSGLRVELTWNTQPNADLDLHMHEPGNTENWCTDADCYYANCDGGSTPPWGYMDSMGEDCPGGMGTCGNPRLDIDNIDLNDTPENINIDNPNEGDTFRIMVHYYGSGGGTSAGPATNPIVSIYCGGVLNARFGDPPDEVTLTQSGGTCGGDTWRVADVTMSIDDEGIATCTVAPLTGSRNGYDVRVNDRSY